ncbi:MAG: transglutaminase-like cysteine peptidase [Desulfobulbus sp.]|jgi:predicted transglutaminase-like cysteine proteinase|nr:transglutaminase-like cysteine peptidase [Desulfobulbus sp.]
MDRGALRSLSPRLPAILSALLLAALVAAPVYTGEQLVLPERTLEQAEKQYGPGARKRLLAWQELLRSDRTDNDRAKIERVNRFFNRLNFVDDALHWHKADYWATPVEFLASEGGDCEDFAIAKYFTLLDLGIDEHKLTLTYVKALKLNQAHMVLTYYPSPKAEPLVLDNLVEAILPSSERTDLLPVYSLNGSGLWLARQRGRGKMVGDSSRLQRWQEMLARMTKEFNQEIAP